MLQESFDCHLFFSRIDIDACPHLAEYRMLFFVKIYIQQKACLSFSVQNIGNGSKILDKVINFAAFSEGFLNWHSGSFIRALIAFLQLALLIMQNAPRYLTTCKLHKS